MHTRTGLQFTFLGAATLFLWCAGTGSASACQCRASTVESSYNTKSDVFIATIAGNLVLGDARYYIGQVDTTYKGCLLAGEPVLLETPASSAACGARLSGRKHLINANLVDRRFGVSLLSIDACSYDVEAGALTRHDREFLDGRYVCCGDDCACADGSQSVECFVDPCHDHRHCDAGECRSNYCGGCNAEFFDEGGYAVCQVGTSCLDNDDCGDQAWCRDATDYQIDVETPQVCVPFSGEGQRCEGYVMTVDLELCAPGLVCDFQEGDEDGASGSCGRPCSASSDCRDDEYCSADGVCERNGRCELDVDCNLADNVYAKPRCLGYGVCDFSRYECTWRCGNPQCADISGYNFGYCGEFLGWRVIGWDCVRVSGCTSGEFELFATENECLEVSARC